MVDSNSIGSLFFLGIYDFRIDLGRLHIGVAQHFANSKYVSAVSELKGRIAMPTAVVVKPKINRRQTEAVRNLKR